MNGLVLLHGLTGGPSSWDEVARHLPAGLPLLRPTLLGHGPGIGAGVRTFEGEVDRLAELVRDAGRAGAHLCGYSLGGRLVLGLVARHPALLSSATVAGAHPGLEDPHARAARAAEDDLWAARLEERGIASFVDAWERLPLFETQRALPDPVRAAHRARRLSHDPASLARAIRVLGLGRMPAWTEALAASPVPLRLVAGERDDKFRTLATGLARRLGDRRAVPPRVHVMENAGHDVPLEAPHALAALLERSLGPGRPSSARAQPGGAR